jgi:hypothetical protein
MSELLHFSAISDNQIIETINNVEDELQNFLPKLLDERQDGIRLTRLIHHRGS